MTLQNWLIFDKSDIRSFSLQTNDILPQIIKKKKLTVIITKLSIFTYPKTLYNLL
jgi:hypothetical protein